MSQKILNKIHNLGEESYNDCLIVQWILWYSSTSSFQGLWIMNLRYGWFDGRWNIPTIFRKRNMSPGIWMKGNKVDIEKWRHILKITVYWVFSSSNQCQRHLVNIKRGKNIKVLRQALKAQANSGDIAQSLLEETLNRHLVENTQLLHLPQYSLSLLLLLFSC